MTVFNVIREKFNIAQANVFDYKLQKAINKDFKAMLPANDVAVKNLSYSCSRVAPKINKITEFLETAKEEIKLGADHFSKTEAYHVLKKTEATLGKVILHEKMPIINNVYANYLTQTAGSITKFFTTHGIKSLIGVAVILGIGKAAQNWNDTPTA